MKNNVVSVRLSDETIQKIEEYRLFLCQEMPYHDWTFADAMRGILNSFQIKEKTTA